MMNEKAIEIEYDAEQNFQILLELMIQIITLQ